MHPQVVVVYLIGPLLDFAGSMSKQYYRVHLFHHLPPHTQRPPLPPSSSLPLLRLRSCAAVVGESTFLD